MDDTPKSLRGDRYAVIRTLGEGGQGATFEAVDKLRGKPVAIKRFRVRGAKSWKEVELAEREAKVLSSLSHPNLPRYVEHFEEGGELFLVTEKIEGDSLAELRSRGRALSEAEVIRFLRDASVALDYLHGRAPPVIHRDIKPSNVIRRPDGSFALIDFGSVRDRMKPAGGSTVVGTFGYMAPEQFQGRAMPASDVYAVATTALTLLTGIEPEDLPHRGLAVDVSASLAGTRASPEITRALAAMLEPDPDRRAARIAPLIEELDRRSKPKPPSAVPRDPPRAEEAWDYKHARRAARREEHDLRRQIKQEVRALRREGRRIERGERGPVHIPGVLLLFMMLGLSIAQVAVTVALRVVVPVIIMFLSVFFGKGMRPAAHGVAEAGKRAVEAIGRAKDFLRGRPAGGAAQMRVEPVRDEAVRNEVRGARVQPVVDTVIDPVGEAEREAEAELAAEAEARAGDRKRR